MKGRAARGRFQLAAAIAAIVTGSVLGSNAHAQDAPPAEVVPPPPPASGTAAACTPACRDGYVCVEGRCLDACNPPCPMGERCTGAGQCVADGPPPPPTYPAGPVDAEPLAVPPAPDEPLPDPPDPDARRHDGFMLRLALGLGGGAASEQVAGGTEITYSGFAGTFSIDLGGAPSENLVLHGRLADVVIVDPDVTLRDPSFGTMDLGSVQDLSLGAMLIAPALSYYFMPVNIYLTGAVGLSWLNVRDATTDSSASTDVGLGVNLDVGKEWWVGRSWGLGIAARVWMSAVTEESGGVSSDLVFAFFGVLFSATYQ